MKTPDDGGCRIATGEGADLMALDWHCRSHNIAAGCCVESKGGPYAPTPSPIWDGDGESEHDDDGREENNDGFTDVWGVGKANEKSSKSGLTSSRVWKSGSSGGDGAPDCMETGVIPLRPAMAYTSAVSFVTCWASRNFSCSTAIKRSLRRRFCNSISCFSPSSFSTSCRLRSREDWAAWRFRRTLSIRRCSFSSSVLARFLFTRQSMCPGSSSVMCWPWRKIRLRGWQLLTPWFSFLRWLFLWFFFLLLFDATERLWRVGDDEVGLG